MHDDDGPPFRVEPAEGSVEKLTVGELGRGVADGRMRQGRQLDLYDPATASSDGVEARIHGQTVEPGIEPVRIAQPGQVPPSSHEGILDRVSRELGVPEDQAGGSVQPRDGRAGQHREGVMIALPRSRDETSLVHDRLTCGAAGLVALGWYGVGWARIVPVGPLACPILACPILSFPNPIGTRDRNGGLVASGAVWWGKPVPTPQGTGTKDPRTHPGAAPSVRGDRSVEAVRP